MNLKQLLKAAGISNNMAKAIERKKLTPEQELEVQEKATAMTKVVLNQALRTRAAVKEEPPFPKKTIIIDEK